MNKLIQNIAKKFENTYSRLILVTNKDGFLANEEVCHQLYEEYNFEVVKGTQSELRIHFELEFKTHPNNKYIYLVENVKTILPDMLQKSKELTFSINDMFPLFADRQLLRKQPLEVLIRLYDGYARKQVKLGQCAQLIDSIKKEAECSKATSIEHLRTNLNKVDIDWSRQQETIKNVSTIICDAINADAIGELEQDILSINQKFQEWVNANYFATHQSAYYNAPKCVNKILPHLSSAHQPNDKIALFVVDGFSYWQYLILRKELEKNHYNICDGATLSWLPSITKLSRQAIFRGAEPHLDYVQNPKNEKQLWTQFWKEQHFSSTEIQYITLDDEISINSNVKRLALVTAEMDEKMHSATKYKELWLLTDYWCKSAIKAIDTVLKKNFVLYLTTDHGSVLATGRRTLKTDEKVFLYKDGSRGARHLIYQDLDKLNEFKSNNAGLDLLHHNNWLCMRDDGCFTTRNKKIMTHGGSHFIEMVIPFVKITN